MTSVLCVGLAAASDEPCDRFLIGIDGAMNDLDVVPSFGRERSLE